MAGEGIAWLAIHQKTNLRDLGKVGMQRTDDGKQSERLRLDPGRMGVDKRSAQVDHRYSPWDDLVGLKRKGHEEYFVHTLIRRNRVLGVWLCILNNQMLQNDVRARVGIDRQRQI